jgi:metal-responsive CopG/Arc/MetJ family transcriptional regulator
LRNEYITVKIPVELAEKLDQIVKDLGYRSRAEIVNDAIRRFLVTKDVEALRAMDHSQSPGLQITPVPLARGNKE